jgi:hypothetical protein
VERQKNSMNRLPKANDWIMPSVWQTWMWQRVGPWSLLRYDLLRLGTTEGTDDEGWLLVDTARGRKSVRHHSIYSGQHLADDRVRARQYTASASYQSAFGLPRRDERRSSSRSLSKRPGVDDRARLLP